MKEWTWPAVSSKQEKEITFPLIKCRFSCANSIQTVKATELRFSSRWSRRFGCRLISWSCCNQILQLREAIQKGGDWREIMFLEIRAIPHSLALTHALTALIFHYAPNTWLNFSCPVSPTSHYGRGYGVKFRSVCECACVRPKIWSHPSGKCPSSAKRSWYNSSSRMKETVWRSVQPGCCSSVTVTRVGSEQPQLSSYFAILFPFFLEQMS